MLLPKFTIRQLLMLMVAFGLISALMAARSNRFASSLGIALFLSVIPFLFYAIVHWSALALARLSPKPKGGTYSASPANIEPILADVADALPATANQAVTDQAVTDQAAAGRTATESSHREPANE